MDEKLFFVQKSKRTCSLFALLFVVAFAFVSCDGFFSTTWGSPRDYDPSKIDVNAGNVDQWIAEAAGNPKLAKAIADKIKAELANATHGTLTPDQLNLQNAGVKLAIEASGLGTALINSASSVISELSSGDGPNGETIRDLLEDIQSDFKATGPAAADDLAAIARYSLTNLSDSFSGQEPPTFSSGYAAP
ncbi:MAG: hypothetical protein LBB48_06585 [Treponema sp.]|jgi:hypothetical protein|nr:hypothetical protein [Treponema sp.]